MPIDLLVLAAAFLTGLLGSAHCGAMCGGIAVGIGSGGAPGSALYRALASNLGRIGGYVIAGAIAGGIGAGLLGALAIEGLATTLRTAVGLVLVWAALHMAVPRWASVLPNGAALPLWQWLAPLRHRVPHDGPWRPWVMGLLWGWLPCGLSLTLLTAAWLEASPWHGAALMLAFGLGTFPLLALLGYSGARWASRWARGPGRRVGAGLVGLAGVLTLAAPWLLHVPALHAALAALGCRSLGV